LLYPLLSNTLENDENIMHRIEDILGGLSENYSILDQHVDLDTQMAYFEFSRNHEETTDAIEAITNEGLLYDEAVAIEDKKALLVSLASIEKPEAYRIIERFVPLASPDLKDWAVMAQLESRMLLETIFSEESQIFISTGLGGRDGKLRYFVALFSESGIEFTHTQKKLINIDFNLIIGRIKGVVESITFHSHYAAMLVLIPMNVAVKLPISQSIDECNSLGQFIKEGFLITNVKILSTEEIDEVISGNNNEFVES
jgi:hypothetical protein